MTPAERRALFFLSAVVLLGAIVRAVRAGSDAGSRPEGEQAALAIQRAAVDSAAAGGRRPRARQKRAPAASRAAAVASTAGGATPAVPAGPVDVDRADAAELDRLPRIGPVMAARIVADRDSLGPFGSLEGLERVRGIGPALAARLAPHVTFSGTPRPSGAVPLRPRGRAARSSPRRAPASFRRRGAAVGGAWPVLTPTLASPHQPWPYPQPRPRQPRHPSASATC